MSTSRHMNKICVTAVAVTLILTLLFMYGGAVGITAAAKTVKYESTLFDTSYVHRIDIVMDDWDAFIETCENEEYASCTVVIDGEKHAYTAIRAKGNTSLSSVRASGSQRYSFKLEFDHYEDARTVDGLDKLCLNNLIQDNTMMKDYLVYQMMADFGADAPLCSFAYLTVNGENWGLYLAVEGVEDSFLERNYGSDTGELYKPDSLSFGGGRGNGKDFNIDDFDFDFGGSSQFPGGDSQGSFNPGGQFPGGMQIGGGMQFGGGMGSDDVKLKYIDDDPDSYANIFDNAKTEITAADKTRLIESLKKLSSYTDLEDVLDLEEVLRYFVVHVFVCNGDSYTGSMIHNYYLHESDGKLSMIPWVYNLAFGTFQGGNASGSVNASIDSPVSGSVDDRPMVGWIFSDDSYTEKYHELFADFLEKWFSNGELEKLIGDTVEMIRPYVEKDPTGFCTTEEFDAGVEALSKFVALRAEAVSRQLNGDTSAVETGDLNLSDMGSMGGGAARPGGRSDSGSDTQTVPDPGSSFNPGSSNPGGSFPGGSTNPGGSNPGGSFPGGSNPGGSNPGGSFPGGSSDSAPSQEFPQSRPGGKTRDENQSSQNPGQERQPASPNSGGTDFKDKISGKTPAGSSGQSAWVLTGISVLVLAAGLFIAVKKRR